MIYLIPVALLVAVGLIGAVVFSVVLSIPFKAALLFMVFMISIASLIFTILTKSGFRP